MAGGAFALAPDVGRGAGILAELQPEFPDVLALDVKASQCVTAGDVFAGLVCWERALFLRQHYLGYERYLIHRANHLLDRWM